MKCLDLYTVLNILSFILPIDVFFTNLFNISFSYKSQAWASPIQLNLSKYNISNTNQTGKHIRPINAEDLKRPDHLEGVKLERDGHLNSEFRKEVFIGKNRLDEEKLTPKDILTDVFQRADINNDKELDHEELSTWIATKVKEHLNQAVKENFFLFTAIDRDHNGIVTWKEYHYNFMTNQGFEDEYARNHAENHKSLDRKIREQILLDQAAFSEAARSNPDGLNIDEFLSFRHPEHSHVTLLNMVQEIFNNLDDNGDNFLSVEEFASFSAIPEANEIKKTDEVWKQEREKEFREIIDTNHDGKVTRQELLFYSDPENPAHSKTEARNLIAIADTDGNGKLSLDEILAKTDAFLGSKMVNTAQNFHDEF